MIEKDKVNVLRTPKDVFEAQIKAWDGLIAQLGSDPFMKKVMDSQKAWSKRVVYYGMFNATDYQGAYEHHFREARSRIVRGDLSGRHRQDGVRSTPSDLYEGGSSAVRGS